MSTAQLSPGTVIDGKYAIGALAHARAGAHGYAATDEQGQSVVVTIYDEACFSSALVLERSLRELRQLQSLQSARVVPVLACGKHEGGIYEVNAPIDGTRLDAVVAQGAMTAVEAAGVIEQVGEGLLEAQKAGVIHRNLGPRVVFVGEHGVRVTGFAVGEPHGDAKSHGPLDTIAPEQIEGKVVDQRTLIYNLAALMHMLLTGGPLFPGEEAAQLEGHLRGELSPDVHARLRRALGKDPRMRPMMLKQFLAELRAIGGAVARAPMAPSKAGPKAPPLPGGDLGGLSGAAPAPTAPTADAPKGSAPSSRGWTMFMKGEGGEGGEGGEAPAVAAKPPAATDVPAKPKTRGWTMFMEAADDEKEAAAAKPAPKPSTRGWTMFMQEDEGGSDSAVAASSEPERTADAASGPTGEADTPAPKPSTRGWTMFMEDEGGADSAAASSEPELAAAASAGATAAPAVGGAAAKPSTRGWTMFMKADEEAAAEAVEVAQAQAPAVASGQEAFEPAAVAAAAAAAAAGEPAVAVPEIGLAPAVSNLAPAPAAAEATPSNGEGAHGWAVAMDGPEAPAAATEEPVASEAAEPATSEAAAEPDPAVTAEPRPDDADAPNKKRGWTVFMDKPITDASKDALGGVVPSTGESNAKGWTVFSPAADGGDEAAAAASPAEQGAEQVARVPQPAASGDTMGSSDEEVAAQIEADADRPRAKTVVVTGQPSTTTPPGESPVDAPPPERTVVTPVTPAAAPARESTVVAPMTPAAAPPREKTVVAPVNPGAGANPMPMAGSGPGSGLGSGLGSGPLSGPISSGSMPMPTDDHELAPIKKSNPAVMVVVGLVVAAAIVGAIVMLS